MQEKPQNYPSATLAGGCFWCLESEYRALKGVLFTRAGYMGGKTDHPTYEQVSTGTTGHAEVIEITFDPNITSYHDLLVFFFTKGHDPTQLNRQGVDKGTQYRSAIFPHDEQQKTIAIETIKEINESGQYKTAIVTTIEPLSTFWSGEDYHQQYYEKYEEKTGQEHIRVKIKKAKKAIKN